MKLLFLIVSLISLNTYANEKGNGGDVFQVGASNITWDVLEYGEPFSPLELSAYKSIDSKLKALSRKIPFTVKLIQASFRNTSWYFVNDDLIEIHDEGTSPLSLSYKKVQVAINRNKQVFIKKDIWNSLSNTSKTFLLLHEALWSINSKELEGDKIRSLTGELLNKYLLQMDSEDIRIKLFKLSNRKNTRYSEFTRYLFLDAKKLVYQHRFYTINQFLGETREFENFYIPLGKTYSSCNVEIIDEDERYLRFSGKLGGKIESFLIIPLYRSGSNYWYSYDVEPEINFVSRIMQKEGVVCQL